jgi:hypothetical protein
MGMKIGVRAGIIKMLRRAGFQQRASIVVGKCADVPIETGK